MLDIIGILKAERTVENKLERTPEPNQIMDEKKQVQSYDNASQWGGVMDGIHIFHLCNLSKLIQPGDRVLDLGCGSGGLLIKAAQLHPHVFFTGVDLSNEMLKIAQFEIDKLNLKNIRLIQDDITSLKGIEAYSYDVVMSTLAVHHLPSERDFHRFWLAAQEKVKSTGAIYISDFARVKSLKTIHIFAKDVEQRRGSKIVKEDYIHSMLAAFTEDDFRTWLGPDQRIELKLKTVRPINFLAVVMNKKPRVPLLKRQFITDLPLRKISLGGWLDFLFLKIFCTHTIKMRD